MILCVACVRDCVDLLFFSHSVFLVSFLLCLFLETVCVLSALPSTKAETDSSKFTMRTQRTELYELAEQKKYWKQQQQPQ